MSTAGASSKSAASPDLGRLFLKVFPSIILPMFLAAIDQTIVATALPQIAGDLGHVERISWVVVSYLLTNSIAAPIYGRIGDSLGRRHMLMVALALFVAASAFCAYSTSVNMLVVARLLQGFGGGGLMTMSQSLLGEVIPPRERTRYQGYLASVMILASTFGPVAGGWLTQNFGWQSVFLVNLPLGLLAFALAFRLEVHRPQQGPLHFDFVGVVLFSAFIAPLLLALEQVQHFDLSVLPSALGLTLISVLALLVLLRQQSRTPNPLLPVSLLRNPVIWRADVLAACVGATIVSLVTFVPIYLEVVFAADPGVTGWTMVPLTACVGVGAIWTSRMVTKTGRLAIFPTLGVVWLAVGMAALGFLAPVISLHELPWLFGLIALSMGMIMPVVQVTVQIVSGPQQLGVGSASVQLSRAIGSSVGTALVGAVLFASLAATDTEVAHLFIRLVEAGPVALAGLDASRVVQVKADIADAFRLAFLTIACFPVIGALMVRRLPVRLPPA